jgi:hypothetical protein
MPRLSHVVVDGNKIRKLSQLALLSVRCCSAACLQDTPAQHVRVVASNCSTRRQYLLARTRWCATGAATFRCFFRMWRRFRWTVRFAAATLAGRTLYIIYCACACFADNKLDDIAWVAGCPQLQHLYVADNALSKVSCCASWTLLCPAASSPLACAVGTDPTLLPADGGDARAGCTWQRHLGHCWHWRAAEPRGAAS